MRRTKRNFQRLAAAGLLSGLCGVTVAQTHTVKKPETVVRALGVYEWTGSESKPTASRFVPVTLFIDGELQDAAVYLARPVPFALQTGTIFELEHAGAPQGTLELAFASHEVRTGDQTIDDGWLGYGAFKPLPGVKEEPSHLRAGKVSQVEVSGGKHPSFSGDSGKPAEKPSTSATMDNSVDPDRPTLSRKTGNPAESVPAASPTTTTSASASGTTDQSADPDRPTMTRRADPDTKASPAGDGTESQSSQSSTKGSSPDSSSDPDRPTMTRHSDSGSGSAASAGTDARAPEDDPDRPTLRRRTEAQRQAARKQHDSSSVTGSKVSLNDDPDRPTLHHGKEPGAMDAEDLPPLRGLPPGVHQSVGVSDAANRPEHVFTRPWEDAGDRAAVIGRMQDFARPLLAGYKGGSAVPPTPATPNAVHPVQRTTSVAQRRAAAAAAAAAKAKAVPTTPVLNDEQLRGYTLSYGGAATFVYSATSPGADGTLRYVTVVAQREPGGELKIAMQSVTDGAHLDRTPRMDLVDAVDVEASNRASLLFELRAQNTRQFALYRVIGAQAEQIFVSGSSD